MRGELLLEDGLSLGIVPTGRDLIADEGVPVAVGLSGRLRGRGVAPDHLVVTLGEGDRIRIGILAAVQGEDLGTRDAPRRDAILQPCPIRWPTWTLPKLT